MDLALAAGIIVLVFFGFWVGLFLVKRWSEKNDSMRGDYGSVFRLWKRPERDD